MEFTMRYVTAGGLTALLLSAVGLSFGQESATSSSTPKPAESELAGYRTVETAITTKIAKSASPRVGQAGFLGVSVDFDNEGRLVVVSVAGDSPAAQAGIEPGDALVEIDGHEVRQAVELRELLLSKSAGDEIKLAVARGDETREFATKLGATSRPKQVSTQRVSLGLRLGDSPEKSGEGLPIDLITPGSPAARAGLKRGEVVLKLDGESIADRNQIAIVLEEKKPGDSVTLGVRRAKWIGPIAGFSLAGVTTSGGLPAPTLLFRPEHFTEDVRVQLAAEQSGRGGPGGGVDERLPNFWKKDVYRLGVLLVEYPDAKHNPKIAIKDWEEMFFSRGTYNETNATGQKVYGSMNDYFQEQSFGKLRIEGKVFDWIELSKKRMDYQQGTSKSPFLTEVMDKLIEREGKEAFKELDGVLVLFAGGRVPTTNRGALYWPHRASFTHQGKRWPYIIVGEGGDRMANISVFCHEFGHLLGLPDLYARPENPGSEGLGAWCAMSNQSNNGRPQHFSAWCKEQLGWIEPAVIDPTVKQKLVLSPIEESSNECFKVLVRSDGSEYLLLENRARRGFDGSIPADGLLIWRVVQRRPMLEESHGVEGPAGPRVFSGSVPYPSTANNSFTPYTIPSSRSQLGGGLPVYITNIRKLADGRVAFEVGFEYQ
jgi:M6 family metalloprotease-like protein